MSQSAALELADEAANPSAAAANGAKTPRLGAHKRVMKLALALQRLDGTVATVEHVNALVEGQRLVSRNMTTLLLTLKKRRKWKVALLVAEWAQARHRPTASLAFSSLDILIPALSAPSSSASTMANYNTNYLPSHHHTMVVLSHDLAAR